MAAKGRKKRMGKPAKKAGKHAAKRARKSTAHSGPIMLPVKARKAKRADPTNPLGIRLPKIPFGYSRDSVMSALVVMLILFAVIGAGVFYPQTKAPQQSLTVSAPVMMKK
jgi:hypothetical protein